MTSLAVPAEAPRDVVEGTTSAAAAAREKAAIEARFVMAMHRPRHWLDVRTKLLEACQRPGFAATAMYAKPVGGKQVVGMSIRFVEEALRCARNVDISAPVVAEDDRSRVLRITVTDLEANVTFSEDVAVDKTVERRKSDGREIVGERVNKKGDTVYILAATEEELLVKQNNQKSKAIRNCGLRVIPGDIVEEARAQVIATVANEDAADPQGATKRLTDAAYTFGISAADIEAFVGCPLTQMTSAHRQLMRETFAAIREGETTWSEAVAIRTEVLPSKKGMASLKAKVTEPPAETKPEAVAPEPSATVESAPGGWLQADQPELPPVGTSEALETLRAEVLALLDDEHTPARCRASWLLPAKEETSVESLQSMLAAIQAARKREGGQ